MNWIIERLKEPSTWAGFSGLSAALGMSGELSQAIAVALPAVFGLLAVIIKGRNAPA